MNFTRAAEECNVTQPSLTRAIKLLEDELGGDLFRRERNLSHLTELGTRMLPLMQQCFDTAQGVKALAGSIKRGEVATLRLALSRTVDIGLLIPHLAELTRAFNGLEIRFLRGSGADIADSLKQGQVDLAQSAINVVVRIPLLDLELHLRWPGFLGELLPDRQKKVKTRARRYCPRLAICGRRRRARTL